MGRRNTEIGPSGGDLLLVCQAIYPFCNDLSVAGGTVVSQPLTPASQHLTVQLADCIPKRSIFVEAILELFAELFDTFGASMLFNGEGIPEPPSVSDHGGRHVRPSITATDVDSTAIVFELVTDTGFVIHECRLMGPSEGRLEGFVTHGRSSRHGSRTR